MINLFILNLEENICIIFYIYTLTVLVYIYMLIFKDHTRNLFSPLISDLGKIPIQLVKIFSKHKVIKDFRICCLGQKCLWKQDKSVNF